MFNGNWLFRAGHFSKELLKFISNEIRFHQYE